MLSFIQREQRLIPDSVYSAYFPRRTPEPPAKVVGNAD